MWVVMGGAVWGVGMEVGGVCVFAALCGEGGGRCVC